MNFYNKLTKEELLKVIAELEAENKLLVERINRLKAESSENPLSVKEEKRFKEKYAIKILDSLPDMLTVISHSGVLVDLVSSEETNHVGEPGPALIGRDIRSMLPEQAYQNIKTNLDVVVKTNKGSIAHHDLWVDGELHHFENRIFPLDNEYVLCMCRDVTQAVNSQNELTVANKRMQLAEDIASLSHWYYYVETKELEGPGIIPLLLGVNDAHVKCKIEDYFKYVHPDDVNKLREQFVHPIDDYFEHRIFNQGKVRYLHTRIIRSYKENGLTVVEGYVQNMTYIVEKIHELEMVKYAVNNAVEEIFSCSLDGSFVFANTQFMNRHRLPENIADYKICDVDCQIGSAVAWEKKIREIRENGGSLKYISGSVDEKGKKKAAEVVTYIILNKEKNEEVIWFFSRDITERIRQENKIKELNYVMDAILNNIPVYLFVKDPGNEFRYLYWNRAFEEYSHIPSSRALGRTDFEIFPDRQNAEKFRRDDLELLRDKERIEFQEEYVTAQGETRIVNTSKALVPSENTLPLIIGVSWDITDMKNIEKELISAKMKAEQSDRLKTAFLANMSHEIRTPLNAIVGFSKLIGDAPTKEEKKQYSEIIDRNSEMLLQLINDILDISKIEAGTLEFYNKPMDLCELCRNIYEVHKGRVQEGVRLELDMEQDRLDMVGDQNRLSQVITNLITNACKFTSKGEIRFGFRLKEKVIDFYVKDTGTGISKEKISTIFERFIKLNSFAQGTGLGLSISKMIIEKMEGQIDVKSEEGKGSVFHFTIPYMNKKYIEMNSEEKTHICNPGDSPATMHTILVAEDVDSNFLLLKALIGKRFNLIRAYNGAEAVVMFKEKKPDLILMDIKMPEMDGLTATKLIRAVSTDIPIIALTAFAFDSDREDALKAGCNDLLTKPLSIPALNDAFHKYLNV